MRTIRAKDFVTPQLSELRIWVGRQVTRHVTVTCRRGFACRYTCRITRRIEYLHRSPQLRLLRGTKGHWRHPGALRRPVLINHCAGRPGYVVGGGADR